MLEVISTALVVACWLVYVPMFIGRRHSGSAQIRAAAISKLGILLQYAGAAIVWLWRRPLFAALPVANAPLQITAPLVAIVLAIGSVYFSRLALQALGNQWGLTAGVISGHRLIQTGPYAVIRHPLYMCFFALTLATGIVWTTPRGLLVAMIIFGLGVWIRVHTEEKILRETFGAEFDDYVKRVPAFLPFSRT